MSDARAPAACSSEAALTPIRGRTNRDLLKFPKITACVSLDPEPHL